jgi:tetratricopeptide (TPR) repeat protein
MRAFVFTDKALERFAGRFVWLSINSEAAANAAFLKRYPIPALPTMLVIDPQKDAVTMRFVGGATVPQLAKMLDGVLAKTQSPSDLLLSKGDRLASDGKPEDALAAYEDALAKAPKSWRNFGRAAEALVVTASIAGKSEACATRAAELYPRLRGTPSGANVAATGLSCAAGLDEKNAKRAELLATLEKAAKEAFGDPKVTVSADDRSGMYLALIDARHAADDDAGVAALTAQWSAFLDDAAAKAKTPAQRTVFDSHRLSAYLNLETPEKAIPMLEQSERDFPDDYNPPARLVVAYKAMKQYDQALAASDRALKHVYGPRKLAVLSARTDLYEAMGDKAAARRTVEESLAYAKSLPEGQRSERRIAALEKKLAAMK